MSEIPRKITYITNMRLPTEKAHGIQIMETCSAFADCGTDVTLVVPRRNNNIQKKDPFQYYGLKENFPICRLPCIDALVLGKIGHFLLTTSFAFFTIAAFVFRTGHIFYTRDAIIAVLFRLLGKKVIWEGHQGEKNIIVKLLIALRVKMVMISVALKDLYIGMGVNPGNICVAPDAVNIDQFTIDSTRDEARTRLGLPLNKKIVLYMGGMLAWKGHSTLAQASQYLKHEDTVFVFVGGLDTDVVLFKKEFQHLPSLLILGNKPRQDVPMYQKAADILVIPNSAQNSISKMYTSPMKLFEYMASGRPIIASDLPSIREIVNESNVYFFTPDDAENLAQTVDHVLKNYSEAEKRADMAFHDVQVYSWKNRARNILEFIQK